MELLLEVEDTFEIAATPKPYATKCGGFRRHAESSAAKFSADLARVLVKNCV